MKVVDTKEYVSVLQELVEEGKTVSLLISGNSMSPFLIHGRDYIYFRKPEEPLRKGDMVFYKRSTGQYVMHRICRIKNDGLYLIGDAQNIVEGPLKREQIFAKVIQVRRKGKMIKPGNFWWEFFEHVWVNMVPLRNLAVRTYALVRRVI